MADVNPNQTATAAIQILQVSIQTLNSLLTQPDADIDSINAKIRALVAEQTDLRCLALTTLEDSPENQAAIAALNTASANLTSEAQNIKDIATAINAAAKVISAASSLISAFAPFLA